MNVPATNVTARKTPRIAEKVRRRFRRTSDAAKGSRPTGSLRAAFAQIPGYATSAIRRVGNPSGPGYERPTRPRTCSARSVMIFVSQTSEPDEAPRHLARRAEMAPHLADSG